LGLDFTNFWFEPLYEDHVLTSTIARRFAPDGTAVVWAEAAGAPNWVIRSGIAKG